MLVYELDDYLNDYLVSALPDTRYKMFLRILNILHNLNITFKNINNIDIESIENNMNDIIHLDDEETDTKVLKLEVLLKDTLITYFRKYGIYFSNDIKLSELEELLRSYHTLLNVDVDMVEYVLMQLEDMEHDDYEVKLASILEMYCNLDVASIYELIDDVAEDIFIKLTTYFEMISNSKNIALSETTINIVKLLTELDMNYNNTFAVKDMIKNGYRNVTINKLLEDMYINIQKQINDSTIIPYEIVATLFIATDTRSDIIAWYKDNFNYDVLSINNTDTFKVYLDETINMLVSKLFEKTLNEGLTL